MKRGTSHHWKVTRLARLLDCSRSQAVGHLVMLWEWCGNYAIDGDLTRCINEAVVGADWDGDSQTLVQAMVESELLDRTDDGKLLIHDWEEHCEEYVKKRLARKRDCAEANGRQRQTTADNGRKKPPALSHSHSHSHSLNEENTLAVGEVSETPPEVQSKKTSDQLPERFNDFWDAYPRHEEKRKAIRAWQARVKSGVDPGDLVAAAKHYAASCAAKGTETRFVKLPATFLGPDKPFEELIHGPPPGDATPPGETGRLGLLAARRNGAEPSFVHSGRPEKITGITIESYGPNGERIVRTT